MTATHPQPPATATRRVAGSASASRAVLRTEFRLFLREPAALFWVVVFPVALLAILGAIPSFREHNESLGGRRVVDLYVPVCVLLSMVVAGIQTMPGILTGYRERGILRRLSATPARPGSLLTAQIILHGCASAVSIVLALVVGRLAFEVAMPLHLAGYALAALLTALSALALGAMLSAVSRTVKVSQTIGSIAIFPAMFTAGLWIPVQTMPDVLRHIAEFSPFGAGSQALDQAATGSWPDWIHLGVTGLWAVLLTGIAVRWFRWE